MNRRPRTCFEMVFLLGIALGAACKHEPAPGENAKPTATLPQVVVDEPGLGGVQVDSVYRQITTDAEATPILGQEHRWMVVHTWMRIASLPESLFVMDDMDRLEKAGKATDQTMVSFVYYRYPLTAKSLDAVRESVAARTRQAPWPPAKVQAALTKRADRVGQR